MFFKDNKKIEKQRLKLLDTQTHPVLNRYLKHPFPDFNTTLDQLEFCALDFETTGLDAKQDAILQIGYTTIRNCRVLLSENEQHLIKINRKIPRESVTIHKITDQRMQQGRHLHDVMDDLLLRMTGKVLIVHFKKIEHDFIQAACQQIFNTNIPLLMIDTLEIGKRYLDRTGKHYPPNALRLFNLRHRFGLPTYRAHQALEDAISTAELFLALIATSGGMQKTQLGNIVSR